MSSFNDIPISAKLVTVSISTVLRQSHQHNFTDWRSSYTLDRPKYDISNAAKNAARGYFQRHT